MSCAFSRLYHFSVLSWKYSKIVNESVNRRSPNMGRVLTKRKKMFSLYLTTHINKVRTRETKREAEEDRLTFDRWQLVNPRVQHDLHAQWLTALVSPPPLSLFFRCPLPCRWMRQTHLFLCFFWQPGHDVFYSCSSGEVVFKCWTTLVRAYREANPFILPRTFRWAGGPFLQFNTTVSHENHCFCQRVKGQRQSLFWGY